MIRAVHILLLYVAAVLIGCIAGKTLAPYILAVI